MTSGSTRLLALCAIAQHFGRPGNVHGSGLDREPEPTHQDRAPPHLLTIEDPVTLRAELAVVRALYNGVRLHAGSATSPPTTSTKDEESHRQGPRSRGRTKPGSSALPGTEQNERIQPPQEPAMLLHSPRISIANPVTPNDSDCGFALMADVGPVPARDRLSGLRPWK